MSITFEVESKSIKGFRINCDCKKVDTLVAEFNDADKMLGDLRYNAFKEGHECLFWMDVVSDVDNLPNLNLANANAGRVLKLAGISLDDSAGNMDSNEFYDKIYNAWERAENLEGSDYLRDRLFTLMDIASAAKEMGRKVVWA